MQLREQFFCCHSHTGSLCSQVSGPHFRFPHIFGHLFWNGMVMSSYSQGLLVTITVWWWLEPWNFMIFHSVGNFTHLTNSIIFQRGWRSTTNQKLIRIPSISHSQDGIDDHTPFIPCSSPTRLIRIPSISHSQDGIDDHTPFIPNLTARGYLDRLRRWPWHFSPDCRRHCAARRCLDGGGSTRIRTMSKV